MPKGATGCEHSVASRTSLQLSDEEISTLSGRISCPGAPPKSREEAEQHLKEIKKLQQYERRLLQEEAEKSRRVREEQEQALNYWRNTVIPDFARQSKTSKTLKAWADHGIPPAVRSQVWEMCIATGHGDITPELYETCRRKAKDRQRQQRRRLVHDDGEVPTRDCGANFSPATGKFDTVALIAVDLPRTILMASSPQSPRSSNSEAFSENEQTPDESPEGKNDSDLKTSFALLEEQTLDACLCNNNNDVLPHLLNELLRAFVELRPDMGYVQGMSYLAAMLLLHLSPAKAFIGFATLITMGHFPYFYSVHHQGMAAYMAVFDEVLHLGCPAVAHHFLQIGVHAQMYVIDWWMSLFSRTLPFAIAVRAWDLYLCDPAYLYRVSLAVVLFNERYLDEECTIDVAMSVLAKVQKQDIDEARFFRFVTDTTTYGPDLATIRRVMDKHLSRLR